MPDLTIANAATLTGAGTASGDLFPLLDISASAGSQGSKITRDELRIGMGITGGGTLATGGFTLTLPATGTAALRGVANTFTAAQTFNADVSLGASAGFTNLGGNSGAVLWQRQDVGMVMFHGQGFNSVGIGSAGYLPGVILGSSAVLGFTSGIPAAGTDLVVVRKAAATLQLGADAAPVTNQMFTAASRITSDGVGANLTIAPGNGRGGAGGTLILATYTTAGAGVIGTLTTRMTIDTAGAIAFPNVTAVVTESVTSDRTLAVSINGTSYKICLKA